MAATAVEYWPAIQFVQRLLPGFTLYLPASHCRHISPSGPVNPGLQVQSACASLALGESEFVEQDKHRDADATPEPVEYLPDTQSLHAALPGDILNLPAMHSLQLPPSKPVEPALQVHARRAVLFAGEEESAGQLAQTPSSTTASEVFHAPLHHSSQPEVGTS